MAGVGLVVVGMLSFVWNDGVARTAAIVVGWIAAGASSAWLLSLACNAIFGMPTIGYFIGLAIGITGVVKTID